MQKHYVALDSIIRAVLNLMYKRGEINFLIMRNNGVTEFHFNNWSGKPNSELQKVVFDGIKPYLDEHGLVLIYKGTDKNSFGITEKDS